MGKSVFTCDDIRNLVLKLYGLNVTSQRSLVSYDDYNFHVLVASKSENSHISNIAKDGYVLKIGNSIDSIKPRKVELVEAVREAMEHVSRDGIITSCSVQNVHGLYSSLQTIQLTNGNANNEIDDCLYLIQLFEFLPGEVLLGKPYTSNLCFQIGHLAAQIDMSLKAMDHRKLAGHEREWSLTEVANLAKPIDCIKDETDRQLLAKTVDDFNQNIVTKYPLLQKGLIHADMNEGNILANRLEKPLVRPDDTTSKLNDDEYQIFGVIDFGDMGYDYLVFEVAIAMMYAMLESTLIDPIDAGGHVLAGYVSQLELPAIDISILKDCIVARLAQVLVFGVTSNQNDPSNTYCLKWGYRGWPLYRRLAITPNSSLHSRWRIVLNGYGIHDYFN